MKTLSALLFFLFSTAMLPGGFFASAKEKAPEEEPIKEVKQIDWEVIQKNGRSYVSCANLAEFYEFTTYEVEPQTESVELRYKTLKLELNSAGNHSEAKINGNQIILLNQTVWDDEHNRLLVSSTDLTYVLEPMIRPSRIKVENREIERERPVRFLLKGAPELIEAFNLEQLREETNSRGFKVVSEESRKDAIVIKIVLKKKPGGDSLSSLSTHWFRKDGERESSALSIAAGASLHSHLALLTSLSDQGLKPITVNTSDRLRPRAKLEILLNPDFSYFSQVHSAIADGLVKMRQATQNEIK